MIVTWILVVWLTVGGCPRGLCASPSVAPSTSFSNASIHWGEFCQFDTLNPACRADEVVVMQTALYGRMKLGTCVAADLGFVGCSKDVLDLLDRRCSGRRSCHLSVPDKQLATRKPCMGELTLYLEASYRCQKVVTVERSQCRRCENMPVTSPSGYIGSVVTMETGCGGPDCPWMIRVAPTQRINLTLINFATNSENLDEIRPLKECQDQVYATIKESGRSETVCAANVREKHVYLSQTNSLELRIVRTGQVIKEPHHFLIHYQTVGCGIPASVPGDGDRWMELSRNQLHVRCNGTSQEWTLHCHVTEWRGDVGSCTGSSWQVALGNKNFSELMSMSNGPSVVIIIIVAGVVGLIILTVGLLAVRRYYSRRHQELTYRTPSNNRPSNDLHWKEIAPSRGNFCEVDRDGYTHIWERPLPTPQQPPPPTHCKLANCSVRSDSGYSQTHAAGQRRESTDTSLRVGDYFITGPGGGVGDAVRRPRSLDSSENMKYYQLDLHDSSPVSPVSNKL